jgi:anti-sigma factor RsiW
VSVDVEQLSCRELVELVTDYLENALPGDERARFDDHLSRCDPCTEYLRQMRQTVEMTGTLSPESLSPEAERALLHAFRGWHTG